MAVVGLFTNVGVAKSIEAQNNEGFKIFPTGFTVSDQKTIPLLPTLTTANAGAWFTGAISSRVVINDHTVKFICTIPPGIIPPATTKFVREIYLNGLDSMSNTFIFAAGQPTNDVLYDPTGSVTLELEVTLSNADLSAQIVFSFTQATEIGEHNTDPNAHPDQVEAINKAGIFLRYGGSAFDYKGQAFDEKADFAGAKSTLVYGGVTFSSDYNGPNLNGQSLTFNGIKTVAVVVTEFNNLHPNDTISHTGLGTVVLAVGGGVFGGGSLSVANGEVVYRDTDGFYKKALADGSIKSRVSGLADLPARMVRASGFVRRTTGYPIGTELFLSETVAGSITNLATALKLGHVVGTTYVLIGTGGGGSASSGAANQFDAIVTNSPGFGNFTTTQAAIAAVLDGSNILIDKLETLSATIDTLNKSLTFTFANPVSGWLRFTGNAEEQKITFSAIPTSGTWRIEWNGNESADLAFNANAATVQAALNAMIGPGLPTTVTGNYIIGFTIVFSSFIDVPEPTFLHTGTDEVQKLMFSTVPDDGTFRINFNGQDTVNIAFNDDAAYIESALEALSNLVDVDVTGNFASDFTVTYKNQDGKQNQSQFTISNNTLTLLLAPVTITPSTLTQGRFPASNLKTGVTPIVISVATLQGGNPIGPTTAIDVTEDNTMFVGYGQINNFLNGINLQDHTGVTVQVNFVGVQNPIINNSGVRPGVDYRIEESLGFSRQTIRTVGYGADYQTLDAAYSAALSGDKIVVFEDQTVAVAKVWTKDIEIEFINDSKLNVTAVIPTVITLGGTIKTRNMHLVMTVAGAYTNAYLVQGIGGYHSNLGLETSGIGVVVTNGFHLDAGSHILYVEGWIKINSSTVTTVLTNSSGFVSHNAVIRDKDNGITHDLLNSQPPVQEVPVGVVDGINNTFVLSNFPANADAVLVMIDGVPRVKTTQWTLAGLNIIFTPGNLPQPSQDVYVYYWTTALQATPPSGRATPFDTYENNVVKSTSTHKINFRNGLDVTLDAAGEVTVDVSPGGGLGTWTNEVHTLTGPEITAKQFNMSNAPVTPTDILVDIVGGSPAQVYGTDFTISGLVFNFNGLGLDGLLAAGDKLRLAYFR
jgi:hypothetical protein